MPPIAPPSVPVEADEAHRAPLDVERAPGQPGTPHALAPPAPPRPPRPPWPPWRQRRGERRARRQALADLRSAELAAARRAELHHMADVLAAAAALVERGWVRGAWLRVGTGEDARTVSSGSLTVVTDDDVTGACLVGAVVHGAGLSRVSSQLTGRSLDVVWQSVSGVPVRPGRACAPEVHRARVRDLTRWNDAGSRRRDEVVGALRTAEGHVRGALPA